MLYLEVLETRCLLAISVIADPMDIDFGEVGVGIESPYTIVNLTNDGLTDVEITEILCVDTGTMEPDDNFTVDPYDLYTLPRILEADDPDGIDFRVRFEPQERGDVSKDLLIKTSDNNVRVDLEGTGLGGNLVISKLVFPQVNPNYVWTGDPLEVSITVTNEGPGHILSSSGIEFDYSPNQSFGDIDDQIIGKIHRDVVPPLEPGESVQIDNIALDMTTVDLTDNPTRGYILAAVNYGDPINAEEIIDDNVRRSSRMSFYTSKIGVFDSVSPGTDGMIDFGWGSVGHVSGPEYIDIINIGDTPVNITDLDFSNEHFGISKYDPSLSSVLQLPPGYDQDNVTKLSTVDHGYNSMVHGEANWYCYDAMEGDSLGIRLQLFNNVPMDVTIYSQYGNIITTSDNSVPYTDLSWSSSVYADTAAPYTGRYYIKVDSPDDSYDDNYFFGFASQYGLVTEFSLSETATILSGSEPDGRPDRGEENWSNSEWFTFDGNVGTQVLITFPDPDPMFSYSVDIFNSHGQQVDSTSVGTPMNTVLIETGSYYIRVKSEEYDEPWVDFDISVVDAGSIFEIPAATIDGPGHVTIPIWFTPKTTTLNADPDLNYLVEGALEITTDAGTSDEIYLSGRAIPGDMAVASVQLSELAYPAFVQSGAPLTVSVNISNNGPGYILDSADLKFYLSYPNEGGWFGGQEILLAGSPEELIVPAPIPDGQSVHCTATVEIPPDITGPYYRIIAVVNSDYLVIETDYDNHDNNYSISPDAIYMDRYSTLAFDSVGNPSDRVINFGAVAIGGVNQEPYVTIYNRSASKTVTITDWSLLLGEDFALRTASAPMTLAPHAQRNIYLQFEPDEFDPQGQPIITDTLTVHTDEQIEYTFSLTGTIAGADLIVTEDSGTPNDNMLELGAVRPLGTVPLEQATAVQAFTIKNNGNQVLEINEIILGQGSASPFKLVLPADTYNLPLNPGDSREIMVTFASAKVGSFGETITIRSTDHLEDYTYVLHATASVVKPTLVVYEDLSLDGIPDDNQLSFSRQPFDTPYETTIYLTNIGDDVLTVQGWTLQNTDINAFTVARAETGAPEQDFTIDPQQIVPLNVWFLAPSDGIDQPEFFFSDTLIISSDDPDNVQYVVDLSGSASRTNFKIISNGKENVGQQITMDSILKDHSNTAPTITDRFDILNGSVRLTSLEIISSGDGFSIDWSGDHQNVAPGQYVTVNVTFDGAGDQFEPGQYNGTIIISAGDVAPTIVNVTATVVSPEIDVPQTTIDFGVTDMSHPSVRQLVISNELGTADLVISDWSWDSNDSQFQLDLNGPLIVPTGQTSTVDVVYDPTIPTLDVPAEERLTLYSNDLDEFEYNITLTGQSDGQEVNANDGDLSYHRFKDSEGHWVHVSLTHGSFELYLEDGDSDQADIFALLLSGTTQESNLNITTTGNTTIGSIRTVDNGSLNSIIAPNVNIEKEIVINGSLDKMLLGNVLDGAAIAVQQPSSKPMTIKAAQIGNSVGFDLPGTLRTFQAKSFSGGYLYADAIDKVNISAGSIGANIEAKVGDVRQVKVAGNIDGDIQAYGDIGKIISKTGVISSDIIAQNGDISSVSAKYGISGMIMAMDDINSLKVKDGSLSDVIIRAQSIKSINALDFNNALVSVAGKLGSVKVQTDIIDSHILAGYDIGMSVQLGDSFNDRLNEGNIGKLSFGGELRNSYVTAGAMADNIYDNLVSSLEYTALPANPPYSVGNGSIGRITGHKIVSDNTNNEFGFYASGPINTKLLPSGDFVIVANL